MVSQAFRTEDEPMITAVQDAMGGRELMDCQPAMLSVDGGAIRARRIIEEMLRQEAERSASAAA